MLSLPLGQWFLVVCITLGSGCWLATLLFALLFRGRPSLRVVDSRLPAVTLFKPVYGLEKNLHENLRTACLQDYPRCQTIFSVQRADDPAIPILRALEEEFGRERVSVVVHSVTVGPNGKINNLCGALPHARHDVFVLSDSDVRLRPDFLRKIVVPLAEPNVAAVTTFFRGIRAESWYEKLELLGLNADQFAMAVFASGTHVVEFCFGASMAFTRSTLEQIGGFEAFAGTLVEDTAMGRSISALGKRLVAIPEVVDITVDLAGPGAWAQKQIYWDQNTLAAVPLVFAAGFLLRVIPLALVLAAIRGFDGPGIAVLGLALAARLGTAAVVMGVALRDAEGLRAIWLIPLKDLLSLVWSAWALLSRKVVWRGVELAVSRSGRLDRITPTTPGAPERST